MTIFLIHCVKQNLSLKLTSPFLPTFFFKKNVATRKFKITQVACIIFQLHSTIIDAELHKCSNIFPYLCWLLRSLKPNLCPSVIQMILWSSFLYQPNSWLYVMSPPLSSSFLPASKFVILVDFAYTHKMSEILF